MFRFFTLLLLTTFTLSVRSQEPVVFNPDKDNEIYLWPMCSYYEDKEGSLTIDDIVKGLSREADARQARQEDLHVFRSQNVEPVIVPNTDRIETMRPAAGGAA